MMISYHKYRCRFPIFSRLSISLLMILLRQGALLAVVFLREKKTKQVV